MCVFTCDWFHPDPRSQLAECKKHLHELETALTENSTCLHPYLKSLNSQLFKAVLTVRSATQEQVPEYPVNEPVAPGKKAETQPRFHATCKTAGRKRKGNVLK